MIGNFTLDNFYWSNEWRTLLRILKSERAESKTNILRCARCGEPIVGKYQCTGHHTVELTDDNINDPEISLNPDLIELIHTSCHNAEHKRFLKNMHNIKTGKKVFLVYGAPLSGKTSAVRSNATDADLIVDLDAIRGAMRGGDMYSRAKYGNTIFFEVRNLLLDRIRTRAGSWENAYIIGGYPFLSERVRLCEDFGASEIFISATKEECLERLNNDPDRSIHAANWERYILEWFEQYEPTPRQVPTL